MHSSPHPKAGQTVAVKLRHPFSQIEAPWAGDKQIEFKDFRLEDWYDRVTGSSWMFQNGNLAAINYAFRAGFGSLPVDNEVVYGKLNGLGYILHASEIQDELEEPAA